MNNLATAIALVALYAGAMPAWAVNKCTGADGKVSFQDAPCDAKAKAAEKVKTWENAPVYTQRAEVAPDLKIEQTKENKALLDLYRRWADAEKLALSTGRIALAAPVANMQAIQREAETLVVPTCLSEAKNTFAELTKKSVQGMLDFMSKERLDGMVYTVVDRRNLIPAFELSVKSARCT